MFSGYVGSEVEGIEMFGRGVGTPDVVGRERHTFPRGYFLAVVGKHHVIGTGGKLRSIDVLNQGGDCLRVVHRAGGGDVLALDVEVTCSGEGDVGSSRAVGYSRER